MAEPSAGEMFRFPSGCFVTGTDTDVGKTLVTAALYRAALKTTGKVVAIKAIQTGVSGENDPGADVNLYKTYARDLGPETESVMLDRLAMACSPHLAAEKEGRRIDTAGLLEKVNEYRRAGFYTIVEGAGGLLVPLNEEETVLDLVRALRMGVLTVFANRVGAINHVLLTLNELRRQGIDVVGAVSNRTSPSRQNDHDVHEDNIRTLARLGRIPILADLPYFERPDEESTMETAADLLRPAWEILLEREKAGPVPGRPSLSEEELVRWDRRHLWHPYTSATDPHPTVAIDRTEGTFLITRQGQKLVDGMASWWCAIHGYGRAELNEALHRQVDRMAHVMFGGITHEGAVRLGKRILSIAPEGLNRIFYADSGSVSVEVAMKMAVQYRHARGQSDRRRLMTFRGGYHGDTIGAMAVCDPVNGMHGLFQGVLQEQVFLDKPRIPFGGSIDSDLFREDVRHYEAAFARHAGETAAFILEPVVQGAGGMWFYHPEYLRIVRELCDRYDILLIADEIATGFGRTGRLFGVHWAGIRPDILCIGKALSGGYMTFAATLASDRIAEGISADGNVFMHGPTFMANPLACAVAEASLEILETGTWRDDVARIEAGLRRGLEPCRDLPGVADVRVLGAIGVVEMDQPVRTRRLQEFFVRRGVWIRPFGKLLYLMPPYCIDDRQLERLTENLFEAVKTGAAY